MSGVRRAEPADLPALPGIEARADTVVVEALGCDPTLFEQVTPGEQRDAEPGFLLVCGRPCVGFAQVLEEDGAAHLQQVCVDPVHARRGRGTALVEACCAEAADRGYDALTLTTFRDVVFNRALYERLGFVVVDRPAGVLARHLAAEAPYAALSPRVGMRRSFLPAGNQPADGWHDAVHGT